MMESRAPGKVKEGLAVVLRDLDLDSRLRVDLDEDEGQLEGRGPRTAARGLREHAAGLVRVPQQQVPVRPVLLAGLLQSHSPAMKRCSATPNIAALMPYTKQDTSYYLLQLYSGAQTHVS